MYISSTWLFILALLFFALGGKFNAPKPPMRDFDPDDPHNLRERDPEVYWGARE